MIQEFISFAILSDRECSSICFLFFITEYDITIAITQSAKKYQKKTVALFSATLDEITTLDKVDDTDALEVLTYNVFSNLKDIRSIPYFSISFASVPMSSTALSVVEEAKKKAMEIAKRLSSSRAITIVDDNITSLLGKREARQMTFVDPRDRKQKKVFMPTGMRENFIGMLIGPKGRTQKEIELRDGCHLQFRGRGSGKDGQPDLDPDEPLYVLVVGDTQEQVDNTASYVEKVMFDDKEREQLKKRQLVDLGLVTGQSATSTAPASVGPEKKFYLTNEKVGILINKGTDHLKRVEQGTGVKIVIATDSTFERPKERVVTLSGVNEHALKRAENDIMSAIDLLISIGNIPVPARAGVGYSSANQMPPGPPYNLPGINNAMDLIYVPQTSVGLIIGKGGETLKSIQMKTGAHIQVVRDSAADLSKPDRPMGLSGTPEQIEAARTEILSYVNQSLNKMGGFGAMGFNSTNSEKIFIPHGQVGTVIGSNGVTIRNIGTKTGAKVQICPETNGPERGVMLGGTKEQMEAAKREIFQIIAEKTGQLRDQSYGSYGASYGQQYGSYGGAQPSYAAYGGAYSGYGPSDGGVQMPPQASPEVTAQAASAPGAASNADRRAHV